MAKAAKPAKPDDDESLKRLGGGRWQTRDGRFTIEPQSGTWAVVDSEETDDLGLPLVRGPFRSLTEAKAAIGTARSSATPTSPLADRLDHRDRRDERRSVKDDARTGDAPSADGEPAPRRGRPTSVTPDRAAPIPRSPGDRAVARRKAGAADAEPGEAEEPGWFRDLAPADRGRARRLIERLTAEGETDAVSIVRRDLVGGVPALAAHAIGKRLAALPADADVAAVADILADGRDETLGVRWRIVDGDNRPILIEPSQPARRRR